MGFRNGVLGSLGSLNWSELRALRIAAASVPRHQRGWLRSWRDSRSGGAPAAQVLSRGCPGCPCLGAGLPCPALACPALRCAALPCLPCPALPCLDCPALPALPFEMWGHILPCPALPFRNCAQWGHILQQQGPCQTRSQTSTSERRAL